MRKTQWSSTVIRLSRSSLASSGHENKIFRSFVSTFNPYSFFFFTCFKLGGFQQSALEITVDVQNYFTTMQHVWY